ncbi:TniQ family protein [Amycolatopsis sp. NPDC049253]|uniref:TniQ family protein n=1 Tax=Amycolatopsis sp. NPDC049253 TaxID=3155274 RepID=UPI0034254F62
MVIIGQCAHVGLVDPQLPALLERDPPAAMLAALADRTGVDLAVWMPTSVVVRVCPRCASDPDRGQALVWSLPLMIGCVEHGCRLENRTDVLVTTTLNVHGRTTLELVWRTTGGEQRAGLATWRPFEQMDWPTRETMLRRGDPRVVPGHRPTSTR